MLRLGEVAEDELDVDVSRRGGLDSVDHAEEMAAVVVVGAGKDSDQEAELRLIIVFCNRIQERGFEEVGIEGYENEEKKENDNGECSCNQASLPHSVLWVLC